MHIYLSAYLATLAFLVGCTKIERSFPPVNTNSVPLGVLGRGVSNQVELGMTIDAIKTQRPDLIITEHRTGSHLKGYFGEVSNLGCRFTIAKESEPIKKIALSVDPDSSSNRFFGVFSCGLSFLDGQVVRRPELIRVLGEPIGHGITNLVAYLSVGKSFALRSDSDPLTEILFYPEHGAIFRLKAEVIQAIEIFPAFTNSPNKYKK